MRCRSAFAVEEETLAFLDAVESAADDISIGDDGEFTVTIDLTEDETKTH